MTYIEIVLNKLPKGFPTTGRCEDLLRNAWEISIAEFGKKQTTWLFHVNEDFQDELVTAYAEAAKV